MRPGSELESLFARAAESVANAALRLDKESRARLAALEDRSVQVESTGPARVFTVRVSHARIQVLQGRAASPDALVTGKLQDLIAWFAAPQSGAAERVAIGGDSALAAELADLFRALAPRGLPLSGDDLLGAAELAGAVIGSAAEGAVRAWRQVSSGPPFVNRDRFSDAQQEIGSLREEIESLAARVASLESSGVKGLGDGPQRDHRDAPHSEDAPE